MKKVLLFASAVALMTSCAKTDLAPTDGPELPKGISFQASIDQDEATKAEWIRGEKEFTMFWYAEQDRISLFSKNTKTGNGNTTDFWAADKVVGYKATKSMGDAWFTSVSDDDVLDFTADVSNKKVKASFQAVWPIVHTTANTADASAFQLAGSSAAAAVYVKLPIIKDQVQATETGGKGATASSVVNRTFMYATAEAERGEFESVGEKISLKFKRPLPIKVFNTVGYDQYSKDFGKIKSVKLEMLGEPKSDGTFDATKAAVIDYGSDAWFNLVTGKVVANDGTTDIDPATATDAAKTITLKFGDAAFVGANGIDWSDKGNAFMNIYKVKASATEPQAYKVTYSFENIDFVKTDVLTNNWPIADGAFINSGTTLDINAEKYLVTNVKTSSDRTLIINSGTLSEILTADKKSVKWGTDALITEFAKIVANVALTNDELALLKGFTNVTDITLAKNTEIPAKTFVKADGTGIQFTSINMPLVTEIANDAFKPQTALTTVKLASYSFANTTVRPLILVSDKLTSLDMSAVMSTAPEFPGIGFQLKGFTTLVDITVMNGLKVGSSTFDGCTKLATVKFAKDVKGSVEIVGINAFKNCEALTAIAISNSAIFTGTFDGCKVLAKIVGADGVKAIQPTSIAAMAFQGCAALKNIDLSQAATIGEAAFKDCTLLEGGAEAGAPGKVLRANAIEVLADEAFSGCKALKYVGFANVTKVGKGVFGSGTSTTDAVTLTELKFAKAITSTEAKPTTGTFGTITATTLFVNAQQVGVKGSTLVLQGTTAGAAGQTSFVFGTIN